MPTICLRFPSLLLGWVALWGLGGWVRGKDYWVTVGAVPEARVGVVLRFELPEREKQPAAGGWELVSGDGKGLPVQMHEGKAVAVVPALAAGEAKSFQLKVLPVGEAALGKSGPEAAAGVGAGVEVRPGDGDLVVTVAGKPVVHYRTDPDKVPRADIPAEVRRAGYLHPVFSPGGHVVTDDYSLKHVHHHGIWAPWVKTKFQGRSPDFWNMHQKTGAEQLEAVQSQWSGPVLGGLKARHVMVDRSAPQPVTALYSDWDLTVYAVPDAPRPVHLFDVTITQACATPDPLELPEYHYGGFGIRGAAAWNGPGNAARFLTSEGLTDRKSGNGTPARWCWLGGAVPGGLAGTTVMGHPGNFRAPQPLRLHPDMPYFSFVPQQAGAFSILPGQPYVMRFRFVVTDGEPDVGFLEACWRGWTEAGSVEVREE